MRTFTFILVLLVSLVSSVAFAQTGKGEFPGDRLVKDVVVNIPFATGKMDRGMNRDVWSHTERIPRVVVRKETVYDTKESYYTYLPHPVKTKKIPRKVTTTVYDEVTVVSPKVGVK